MEKESCKEDKFEILVSALELRLPLPSSCLPHEVEENRDNDLVKTPRGLEPVVALECPSPPRKPRRLASAKRKAGAGQAVLMSHDYLFGQMGLDLELLFPSNLLGGKIIKKVKRSVE